MRNFLRFYVFLVICETGYFAEITDNRGKCELCPESTYQPFSGQSACLPCPCRFVTNGTGKTSEKDCEPTNVIREKISKSGDGLGVGAIVAIIAGLIFCIGKQNENLILLHELVYQIF